VRFPLHVILKHRHTPVRIKKKEGACFYYYTNFLWGWKVQRTRFVCARARKREVANTINNIIIAPRRTNQPVFVLCPPRAYIIKCVTALPCFSMRVRAFLAFKQRPAGWDFLSLYTAMCTTPTRHAIKLFFYHIFLAESLPRVAFNCVGPSPLGAHRMEKNEWESAQTRIYSHPWLWIISNVLRQKQEYFFSFRLKVIGYQVSKKFPAVEWPKFLIYNQVITQPIVIRRCKLFPNSSNSDFIVS